MYPVLGSEVREAMASPPITLTTTTEHDTPRERKD